MRIVIRPCQFRFCQHALVLLAVFTLAQPLARGGLTLQSGDVLLALDRFGQPPAISVNQVSSSSSLTTIASGGGLGGVSEMEVASDGRVYVTDPNRGLIRIDPRNGAQTVVMARSSNAGLIGLAVAGSHVAFVGAQDGLFRVNLDNATNQKLSDGLYSNLGLTRSGTLFGEEFTPGGDDPGSRTLTAVARLDANTGQRLGYVVDPTTNDITALAADPGSERLAYTVLTSHGRPLDLTYIVGRTDPLPDPFPGRTAPVSALAFDPAGDLLALYNIAAPLGESPTVAITRISATDPAARWQTIFSQTADPGQSFFASGLAVAPGGGAQAIPLPAAAGPGVITLGFIGLFVTWRRASSRRPC